MAVAIMAASWHAESHFPSINSDEGQTDRHIPVPHERTHRRGTRRLRRRIHHGTVPVSVTLSAYSDRSIYG